MCIFANKSLMVSKQNIKINDHLGYHTSVCVFSCDMYYNQLVVSMNGTTLVLCITSIDTNTKQQYVTMFYCIVTNLLKYFTQISKHQ